jgi:uncharacterized iron-regulated membrane protein
VRLNLLVRKVHSWGAILAALPVLIIIASGILLQLKKQVAWVQPPEQRGVDTIPAVTFPQVLAAVSTVPHAEVRGWPDVRRLDVRPDRGIVKVWTRNGWEVQVDLRTARVLQSAYRRSDIIEAIHDGSWFHDRVKLWVWLPSAVVLLSLWVTGVYLFWLPIVVRARRPARERRVTPDRRA